MGVTPFVAYRLKMFRGHSANFVDANASCLRLGHASVPGAFSSQTRVASTSCS